MRQLSGMDTYFLGLEDSRTQGHISCLAVLDPSTAPGGDLKLDDVRELIAERLHLIPPFRWRLVEVPFGIDYPYWLDDPDFDLDFHVRELALPAPGNYDQLTDQLARVFSRPLDRRRPLWEIYLIQGLEGGRAGLFTKVHHAAVDGMTGAEILGAMFDLDPAGRDLEPPESPSSEPEPGQVEMLARGLVGSTIRPWRSLRAIPQLLPGMAEPLVKRLTAAPLIQNLPLVGNRIATRGGDGRVLETGSTRQGPPTPFGGRISPHRRIALGSLSLERIKAAKNAHGTTVNDVVVAICAGALRRWLQEREALPDSPLLASVPISVRAKGESSDFSNQVSVLIVPIPTAEPDPLRRLERAHRILSAAKERHSATPAAALQDAQNFVPPWTVARASRVVGALASSPLRVFPNLNITNVPGPPVPVYCAGARLEELYPIAPVFDTVPLNLAVMSYMGQMYCSVVGDRDKMADAGRLVELMREELDELHAAV